MPVIGLTGGIATGKSTVGRMLAERGAVLISADEVSRAVTAPGSPVLGSITEVFGVDYIKADGSLDRSRLAALVFRDPVARQRLEAITHPVILDELLARIDQAQTEDPTAMVVVEVPLLFEAGMESWFDAVLTVTAAPETQRRRLMERDGLSKGEADARIASQLPVAEKAARSRFVLANDGELSGLAEETDRLMPELEHGAWQSQKQTLPG